MISGRTIATVMAIILILTTTLSGVSHAAGEEETQGVMILIDHGDGRLLWIEANITEDSAFNATLAACENAGMEIDYSISEYGVMVNSIDGEAGAWPGPWWHFWLWNSSSSAWELSTTGSDSATVRAGDSIAWSLVAGYPGDRPAATPEDMYPWWSYRNGNGAPALSGTQPLTGEVNRTIIDPANGFIDSTVIAVRDRIVAVTSGIYNWTTFSYDSEPAVIEMDLAGKEIWRTRIGGAGWQTSSPLYAEGMIIVGSTDGKLYALDFETGSTEWIYQTGQSFTGITSSPLYWNSNIYVGSGDGFLYSIALNGSLNWKFNTTAPIYAATPTTDGIHIFIGNDAGIMYAIYPNGTEAWNHTVSGKIRSAATVVSDMVVFTSSVYENFVAVSGNVTALSRYSGEELWQVETEASTASIAWNGEHIIAAAGSSLLSFSTDGEAVWAVNLGGPVKSSPTICGDVVYAATWGENSTLYALYIADGKILWNDTIEGGAYVLSSPVPYEGGLYLGADTGHIYIYRNAVWNAGEEASTGTTDGSGEPVGDNGLETTAPREISQEEYAGLVLPLVAMLVILFVFRRGKQRGD